MKLQSYKNQDGSVYFKIPGCNYRFSNASDFEEDSEEPYDQFTLIDFSLSFIPSTDQLKNIKEWSDGIKLFADAVVKLKEFCEQEKIKWVVTCDDDDFYLEFPLNMIEPLKKYKR